ncbi:hypothetical protein cyc_08582 [Cyclospora cayetanensis]|uniref:Uncharacterized protein n=1 Tax=Cyclospora cayetanensis TaxID=88456 RepID=A0A1D3DB61_9EIME|nr:hypothetical protein cyc_08582 [Cyclospora cayetanensis]
MCCCFCPSLPCLPRSASSISVDPLRFVQEGCCLSSFFERIVVLTGSQTVAWHWGGGDPVEELVLQRRGDTPLTLKILFFLKHRLPTFGVFGSDVQTFGLPDLPELLRQHLLPPTPVVITHNLRLSGDWLESEHTYDFSLDCIDTTCSGSSNCSAISSAATACCVLGLESWLAAPHQHALSPAQQQKQLALNAEMDTLDSQLTLLLQQIHQRVAQMQLYSALAKDPKEFILKQLESCVPDHQRLLADESCLFEYQDSQRRASFYAKVDDAKCTEMPPLAA